jgi:TolB-like protein/Tfp pilus assembly protein PilF
LRTRLEPQAVDYSGGGVVALVVMPFANDGLSDQTIDLAARMLTADLADSLSQLAMFRVISNQTAETYRGQSFDAAAVGRDLGVRYVLEGSIMSRGEILQVNAQLVDARTRSVVWSGRFERTGSDLFTVQSEIINEIGREMRLKIEGLEDSQASADPDVHELVFKGWGAINAGRRQGVAALRAAEGYFTEALKREPENTRALNGLAAYQVRMAIQLFVPNPAEYLAKAESIARQLIAQHPKLAGPYVTLGLVQSARDENEAALQSFEHAIVLNPSNAPVHAHVGRVLIDLGHAKEGLEHITYAMRLSPHDPTLTYMFAFAGEAELELGHVDAAIKNFERSAKLQPGQPQTLLGLMSAYAIAGRLVDARTVLSRLQKERPYLTTAALLKLQSKKLHHPIANEGLSRLFASH